MNQGDECRFGLLQKKEVMIVGVHKELGARLLF